MSAHLATEIIAKLKKQRDSAMANNARLSNSCGELMRVMLWIETAAIELIDGDEIRKQAKSARLRHEKAMSNLV